MVQGRQAFTVLALLAFAFVVALIVNWGVLAFFGQESADRAEHSLVGILLLIALMAASANNRANFGRAVGIFLIALVPCYLGTVFPDLDIWFLGFGSHRNPLFHSSLSFLVLVLLIRGRANWLHILAAAYGVGLASHLWWDVVYYGDVRWLPGGAADRLWLGINGLLCLIMPSSRALLGRVRAGAS